MEFKRHIQMPNGTGMLFEGDITETEFGQIVDTGLMYLAQSKLLPNDSLKFTLIPAKNEALSNS